MSTQKEKGQLRITNPTTLQVAGQLPLLYRWALRGSKRESQGSARVEGGLENLPQGLLPGFCLETQSLRSQGGHQCGKDGLGWPGLAWLGGSSHSPEGQANRGQEGPHLLWAL